eukprot:TRINITY_DN20272_c0_g1_i2.p1 TRINITY_DN20272_c0_g1~~TRINITY_DN20272_c0_g1_i2.p1  ORF type:complete len:190 (-),score=33.85 TRINITY_DN20272_c0_g1_i2:40-609(-)
MFTDGVVMYRFSNLCTEAAMFGPTDFQLIARTFHTVILLDVPQIGAVSKNCAKQFIILVDELYQHNVKLCMTTGVPWGNMFEPDHENPDERDYYTQGEDERSAFISETNGSFRTHEETLSYSRIASRLTEMSTMEYLLTPHTLSLIHISEPTRLLSISYAVFCLKKKKNRNRTKESALFIKTKTAQCYL